VLPGAIRADLQIGDKQRDSDTGVPPVRAA
jgi:hypothetical protein